MRCLPLIDVGGNAQKEDISPYYAFPPSPDPRSLVRADFYLKLNCSAHVYYVYCCKINTNLL